MLFQRAGQSPELLSWTLTTWEKHFYPRELSVEVHDLKGPVLLFRGFVGDEILPNSRDYFIDHEIRILIDQPIFHGK